MIIRRDPPNSHCVLEPLKILYKSDTDLGVRRERRGGDVYGQACDLDHSLLCLYRLDLLVGALRR